MKLVIPQRKKEEEKIVDISFNIHKFNNRPRPTDTKKIVILGSFSEFGCETVSVLYGMPRFLEQHVGKYIIVMGWYGREYSYRHLVDEYWELKEEYQWLREYSRAFYHVSKNLENLETKMTEHGIVYPSKFLSIPIVMDRCKCGSMWGDLNEDKIEECPQCKSQEIVKAIFRQVQFWKRLAIKLPIPSKAKLMRAQKYLKPNSVGIFARGRKTYGRNLEPEFYIKLIELIRELGYEPVWLGEKQSTLPCPVPDVIDFSRMEESKDLELTFAIVKQCQFTVQFWTASTRIAGMMGVPYLLFESPDQIWGQGQEGYRRNLCDFGPSKLCVSHFLSILDDPDAGIALARRCIEEMQKNNYEDVFGLVEDEASARELRRKNAARIGSID